MLLSSFPSAAMTRFLRLALAFSILAALASALRAQTVIVITNADFETDGLADGTFSNSPGVYPTGWSSFNEGISGGYFGYYNPDNSAYSGTAGSGVTGTMAGPNVFYFGSAVDGEGIQQALSTHFAADTDYTLTVAVGMRSAGASNTATAALKMELLAGSTVIASSTVRNSVADSFADFSLTYSSAESGATFSSLIGEALTIRFKESDSTYSGEMDIDNVRLTSSMTSVPEPSTYALMLAGGLLLGLAAWRRRTA